MIGEIVIGSRFCGPPGSGNGGYTCGRVAAFLGGEAEVTLRVPPPLDTPLRVERAEGRVQVYDGDVLVAEAAPAVVDLEPPAPPSLDDAARAAAAYPGFDRHAFPTCFVCGPDRAPGDGLRIFAGPLAGGMVAAPWTPDESLGVDGVVAHDLVWASLDCPGAIAVGYPGRGETVLGRFAARVDRAPRVGEECVVVGWPLGEDGRKLYAGTALYAGEELLAVARAVWIVPRS